MAACTGAVTISCARTLTLTSALSLCLTSSLAANALLKRCAVTSNITPEHRLNGNGWQGRAAAAVIEPELEVLLWQDNTNVERALRHRRDTGLSLRRFLAQDGRWPPGEAKPLAPKEVIQALIRANRAGPPMVVYSQIARAVSTAGCVDPAFNRVRDMLRAWFPAEGA